MGGMQVQRLRWFRTFVWCLLVTFGLQVTLPALPAAASPLAISAQPSTEAMPPFTGDFMANLGAAPLAPKHVHFAPDPVNLSNGNLYLPMRDLYLPAYRFSLTIDRAYNSRSTEDGPFGFGWSFNYGVKVRKDTAGLLIQEGDGSTRRYQSSGNGFESKVGAYSRMAKSPDGGYVRTRAGGIRERFNPKGRLVRLEDGNGYWVQLTYHNDRLASVKDGAGRSLAFTYNRRGKIATIKDSLGRTLQYRYADRGDLMAATDLSGHETQYAYDDLHNLIGIRYPDGAETTMTYDTQRDLIISERGPGGRLTSYQYLISPVTPDQYSVVVIDGLGRQTVHAFRNAPAGMTLTTTNPLGGTTTKTYDQRGNLVMISDPLARATRYRYDQYNRVTHLERPDGTMWKFDYHDTCGCGEPTAVTDPLGQVTRFAYDQHHNLMEIRDAAGQVTRIAWEPKQQTRAITRPGGAETVLAYNAAGLPVHVVAPEGNVTHFTYDAVGRLVGLVDAKGATYRLEYDPSDRLVGMTTPLGGQMAFAYDSRGRLLSVTDLDGGRTHYVYGAFERPIKFIDATGSETSFEYDIEGQLTTRIDALGRRSQFRYDAGGRLVEVEMPTGVRTRFAYDAVGNLTAATDASGTTSRLEYDALDRRVAVVDGLGSRTAYRYNAVDRLTHEIDAEGRETVLEYDAVGRLIKALNLLGNTAQYAYDAAGNLVSRTDAKGAVTQYAYDRAGRLMAETDALGRRTEYARDVTGLPTRIRYPDGQEMTFGYDDMERLVEARAASGVYERRVYTPGGRLQEIETPAGVSRFEHDLRGRLVRVEDASLKKQINYLYDQVGNRLSMTVRGFHDRAYEFTYQYDSGDRLVSLRNPFNEETRYHYDALGRRVREALANAVSVEYRYDPLGRVVGKFASGPSAPLLRLEYVYDRVGLIREVRDQNGNMRFAYDGFRQLAAMARNGGNEELFTYDPAGNLRSGPMASGAVQFTSDQADQLTSVAGAQVTYDRRGNLTAKLEPQGVTRLAYDGFNRLTAVTLPDGQQVSYTYGSNGQLQTRRDAHGTRHFLHDGAQLLMELEEDLEPRKTYTRGVGLDEVISHRQGDQSLFYHTDPFRTVRGLSDHSSQLVARYDYAPFGRLLTTSPAPEMALLFTGRPYDVVTGIMDYRLRQYDATLGRFLQRDPLNLMLPLQHAYAYVGNNPVNRIDPYGLWFNSLYEAVGTITLAAAGVAAVAGGLVAAGVIAVPAAVATAGTAIAAAAGTAGRAGDHRRGRGWRCYQRCSHVRAAGISSPGNDFYGGIGWSGGRRGDWRDRRRHWRWSVDSFGYRLGNGPSDRGHASAGWRARSYRRYLDQ